MALRLHFIFFIPQPFGGISQNIKCSFRFILSPLNWRRIVKHGEIVILFPIALFRVMFSTIPSGSCTHTHLHKKKQHTTHSCLLEPPMEEHSVLGWGEPFFFLVGGGGADRERKRLLLRCCVAVLICFEMCLTCGDWLTRKAWHCLVNACGFFGKTVHSCRDRMWLCVCFSEAVWVWCHGDLKGGQPVVLHQCWVIRTHLLSFQGNWLWSLRGVGVGGRKRSSFCWRGLYVMLAVPDTQWALGVRTFQ